MTNELISYLPHVNACLNGTSAVLLFTGYTFIRSRNVAAHRAWMMRAYALAIAAGTQPITLAPMLAFPKLYGELGYTLGLAAGWLLNLLVAEWLIRRSAPHPLDRDMAEARATLASR